MSRIWETPNADMGYGPMLLKSGSEKPFDNSSILQQEVHR
jgi:hypothetical protein